jgi:hypothetical protein
MMQNYIAFLPNTNAKLKLLRTSQADENSALATKGEL